MAWGALAGFNLKRGRCSPGLWLGVATPGVQAPFPTQGRQARRGAAPLPTSGQPWA